jgi:hypothetical protein
VKLNRVFVSRAADLSALCLVFALAACGNDDRDGVPGPAADAGSGDTSDTGTTDGSAATACDGEDALAPNHALATATPLPERALDNRDLFICPSSPDWFALQLDAGQALEVEADTADVSVDLLDATGLLPLDVARERGQGDSQIMTYQATDAGLVHIVVSAIDGSFPYGLKVRVGCTSDADCGDGGTCSIVSGFCDAPFEGGACGEDGLEPNNSVSQAVELDLSEPFFSGDLVVCEDDDDYFRFTLSEPSTVRGAITFDAGNNLNAILYRDGQEFTSSASEEDGVEEIIWRVLPAGDYTLLVDDAVTGLGLDVGYGLALEAAPESCTNNNECAAAVGRSVCVDGGCVSFTPDEPASEGGACDDSGDCADPLGCYTFGGSFEENFCTLNCGSDAECSGFDGGYCLGFGGQTGICFGGCETALDCPDFTDCDTSSGRCDFIGCRVDSDCGEGAVCRRTEDNFGACSRPEVITCSESDEFEPNDAISDAPLLEDLSRQIRDLTICDADEDWYRFVVEEESAQVIVRVQSDTGRDMDVYVYTVAGRAVADGTAPDANPEVATGRRLPPGEYLVRVDQFPREEQPDGLSRYSLEIEITPDAACTTDGEECLENTPLRYLCDDDSGACVFRNGNGEVELGDFCDTSSDCVDEAEFCWTFSRASQRRNICTRQCGGGDPCDDVPGTSCVELRNGASICLAN